MDILQCWEFCTRLAKIVALLPRDELEKAKYLCWLILKVICETSLMHGEKLKRDGDYVLDVLLKFRPPPGSTSPEKKCHRGHRSYLF